MAKRGIAIKNMSRGQALAKLESYFEKIRRLAIRLGRPRSGDAASQAMKAKAKAKPMKAMKATGK